jgi:two-component system phosphate regulon response regulator PhoB
LARLLVVDSSAEDRASISRHLRDAGHDAVCAADAAGAMEMLQAAHFDAVITEWRLADTSALDLAAILRGNPRSASARILVASACNEPGDIARALDSGIDDYLIKPSLPEVLVARVNAALRRPAAVGGAALHVGPVSLDRVVHRVTVAGHIIALAPAEFRLLAYLMENRDRVIGRKQLLAQVWNRRKGIGERTVDVHVRRLRAALTPHNCENLLQTVRGFGYRFG